MIPSLLVAGLPVLAPLLQEERPVLKDKLVAPALEADLWVGAEPNLAELQGQPFVYHSILLGDERTSQEMVPLFRDLIEANSDASLRCIAFARYTDEAAARAELASLGIDYPVGLVSAESHPYLDVPGYREHVAGLIGPSGDAVWLGDPFRKMADFSANVREIFRRQPVPTWTGPVSRRIEPWLIAYHSGRLSIASKQAQALLSAAGEETELGRLAKDLVEHTDRARELWWEQARSTAEGGDVLGFVRVSRAIGRGLVDADSKQALKALTKSVRKANREALASANRWEDLSYGRPALFPVRRTESGERFAMKLEGFLEQYPDAQECEQVRTLLARYRSEDGR